MLEHIITASALILALLVVRKLFWNTLSRRVQYALWGLVLLRLLIPWNLPAARFSVLNAAAPVQQAVEQQFGAQVIVQTNIPGGPILEPPAVQPTPGTTGSNPAGSATAPVVPSDTATVPAPALSLTDVLRGVWIAGMAVLALFFLLSNLRFALRVRRCRKLYREKQPGHPAVYLVPEEAVPSPCLFGGVIYVTPTATADPERLRMVLLHEETHARHGDPLWSLLRCLCLTIWWFNPLVWAAGVCSRADCELACDESVLQRLGEGDGYQYGEALLSLVRVKGARNPLCVATAMSSGAKRLKERIRRIVRPRQVAAATLIVLLLAITVCACTFTGGTANPTENPTEAPPSADNTAAPSAGQTSSPSDASTSTASPEDADTRTLSDEEIRWFNETFFNGEGGTNIHNQFANPTNLYSAPQNINLFDLLFVHGYGEVSAEEYQAAFGAEAPSDPVFDCWKITTQRINTILQENMGLTLEETAQNGMDRFAYAEGYDAYYWSAGGTNWTEITVQAGTETDNLVTLYHYSTFGDPSWYAITLERQEDGSWHFRSNVACDASDVPTQTPEQEPQGPAVTAQASLQMVVETFDEGAATTKLILTLEAPVSRDTIRAEDFLVEETKLAYDPAVMHGDPVVTPQTSPRTVTNAYTSDEWGNPVAVDSQYITLELSYGRSIYEGNGFLFFYNPHDGGHNVLSDPHSMTVSLADGSTLTTQDGALVEGIQAEPADLKNAWIPALAGIDRSGTYNASNGEVLTFASYAPANAADGAKHPLVIWLADSSERGTDPTNILLANRVPVLCGESFQSTLGGAYVLIPQTSLYWTSVSETDYESPNPGVRTWHTDGLMELIHAYCGANPTIDPDRILIGGTGAGGYMAFNMVLEYPDTFAAAFPVSEPYPFAPDPAVPGSGCTDDKLSAILDLPIWFVWAEDSPIAAYSEDTAARLVSLGVQNVHETVLPAGSSLTPVQFLFQGACHDGDLSLWTWLAQQHRS